MRTSFFLFLFVLAALPAAAQDEITRFLFTNIHVFDGVNEQRIENANVLVEGNRIVAVSTEALDPAGARIIDGGGRTMIPGLIDSHQHVMLTPATEPNRAMLYGSIYDTAYNAVPQARKMLDMGITSIRDLGGPSIELGRAIDAGHIPGPRILSAGHFIGATSGHGDFAGQRRIGPSQ